MVLQIELYESLIGENNIDRVLDTAAAAIQKLTGGANTAIWLSSGFETHLYDEESFTLEQTDIIEGCFNCELSEKIYNSRRCIELDELFEMGLPESEILAKLSGAAIPLFDCNCFIFVYRDAAHPVEPKLLNDISLLIPGLSKAVKACRKSAQSAAK